MIRSRLMRPVQVKNKPDLNTLSAVGPVERRHSPCDLKPFDNSPKCQDESLGIASADSPFSKEPTNALNPRFKAFVGSLEKGLSAEAIPRDSSWHLGELSNGFRSHGEWRRSTGPTAERVLRSGLFLT